MKIRKLVYKELGLAGLTRKQIAAAIYFILSLCLLSIPEDSPILLIVAVVINFLVSALCVKKTNFNIKVD